MRFRTLMLGALTAGLAATVQSANADTIELAIPAEIMVAPHDPIATITVDGDKDGPYDKVTTKTLDYIVAIRGSRPSNTSDYSAEFHIRLLDAQVKGTIKSGWAYYKISAPYADPWLNQVASARRSPIEMCNERLDQTSGQARQAFLNKGAVLTYEAAYPITGEVSWWIEKRKSPPQLTAFTAGTLAPLKIRCMNLQGPRPRENSETRGAPPRPGKPLPPTIKKATLRIEPAHVVRDGKFLCPQELKLHGYMETIREFYGKSIFVGPHYLSALTTLNLPAAGSRNVNATYKVDWHPMGGFTTAPNTEPKKQTLTFHFNVSDKDGKLLKSMEETVGVSCRKIEVNAPTAGDGMTVNP